MSRDANIRGGSNSDRSVTDREALGEASFAAAPHVREPRLKTNAQVRAIFGLAKAKGLDNDALHELVANVLTEMGITVYDSTPRIGQQRRTASIAQLRYTEAERVIQRLKGESFVPRRTQQYRRAKSNVSQIMTPEQRDLIAALAAQRNWSPATLQRFCIRQCGHYARTTTDANKVIEALKAMNRRDGLWAAA